MMFNIGRFNRNFPFSFWKATFLIYFRKKQQYFAVGLVSKRNTPFCFNFFVTFITLLLLVKVLTLIVLLTLIISKLYFKFAT